MTTPAEQFNALFDSKSDTEKLQLSEHIAKRLARNNEQIQEREIDLIEAPSSETEQEIAELRTRSDQYLEMIRHMEPEVERIKGQSREEQSQETDRGQTAPSQEAQHQQTSQSQESTNVGGEKKFPTWLGVTAVATTGPLAGVLLIPKVRDWATEKFGKPAQPDQAQNENNSKQKKKWYQPTFKKALLAVVSVGVLSQGGKWYNDQQAAQDTLEENPDALVAGNPQETIPDGFCELEPGAGLLEHEAEMALLENDGNFDEALLDLELALDEYASERCGPEDVKLAKEAGVKELEKLIETDRPAPSVEAPGRGLGD